jgi:hypothetical protein
MNPLSTRCWLVQIATSYVGAWERAPRFWLSGCGVNGTIHTQFFS